MSCRNVGLLYTCTKLCRVNTTSVIVDELYCCNQCIPHEIPWKYFFLLAILSSIPIHTIRFCIKSTISASFLWNLYIFGTSNRSCQSKNSKLDFNESGKLHYGYYTNNCHKKTGQVELLNGMEEFLNLAYERIKVAWCGDGGPEFKLMGSSHFVRNSIHTNT